VAAVVVVRVVLLVRRKQASVMHAVHEACCVVWRLQQQLLGR
jgi:hypothetical protein